MQNETNLWQEMADHTFKKCKEYCRHLGSCCCKEYCESAKEYAESKGVSLGELPFLKEGKCIVPPNLRPLCTVHQCIIASLGCDPKDDEWTKKYFELREKLEEML